jgi:hypothetical protein
MIFAILKPLKIDDTERGNIPRVPLMDKHEKEMGTKNKRGGEDGRVIGEAGPRVTMST